MRWAYADPPYPGQARRHYSHDPNAKEVNHLVLVGYLNSHFDAWALSTSSPGLDHVMACTKAVLGDLCFSDSTVRIMPWVKPFAVYKPGVRVAYAWEPVLVKGWRKGTREAPTIPDWVAANITMRRGLAGAKPEAFCFWLFEMMGALSSDDFEDVFPGSDAVSNAWAKWCGLDRTRMAQQDMFASPPP